MCTKLLWKLFLLPIVCMNLSCSMWKETYENPDRICWQENVFGKIKCEAFIDFQCPEYLTSIMPAQGKNAKRIYVELVDGPQSPRVGYLLAFPIFVKNGSPWETLHNDITQILSQLGYEVTVNADDTKNIIQADVTFLDVRSVLGGFTDFKIPIDAKAIFKVILRNNNEEEVWSDEFIGEHQIKVFYSYLKDHEKTLGQAYCRSLESFSQAAQTPEFKNKVR